MLSKFVKFFKWKTQLNNGCSVLQANRSSNNEKGTGNLAYFDKNRHSFQN